MMDTYDITYDGKRVGRAQMEKQGLYYSFSCRCSLPQEGLYRIHVTIADKREDLGICIPLDGAFGMDKKISVKKLGEGTPSFELLPKDWQPALPVEPEPQEEYPAAEDETATSEPEEAAIPEPEDAADVAPAPEEPEFVPVSEEEPFGLLDQLEAARMEIRDDIPGIVIPAPPNQDNTEM